jgi:hypothetical protein
MSLLVLKIALFVLCFSVDDATGFKVAKLFSGFKLQKPLTLPSLSTTKAELFEAVSFISNGKDASLQTQKEVLGLV